MDEAFLGRRQRFPGEDVVDRIIKETTPLDPVDNVYCKKSEAVPGIIAYKPYPPIS